MGARAARPAAMVLAAAVVAVALLPAIPAAAVAAPPAAAPPAAHRAAGVIAPISAEAAKQAWIAAARRAETYNEQVLATEAAVTAAKATAAERAAAVRSAARATTAERKKAAQADAVVAAFQRKVDEFANASFRGARLGEISVLLTAASPENYLDQASSLGTIADDQQTTLTGALQARKAADTARARAQAGQERAQQAKDAAEQAAAKAERARADLEGGRAKLGAEIGVYELAYARLSAADVSAAAKDVEAANVGAANSAAAHARQAGRAAQRSRSALADDIPPAGTGPDFSTWAARHAPSVRAGIAVTAALSRQGLPYVWAAVGPDSFDCSGLMLWAWQQAGVVIPRDSASQSGLREIPLERLQPGDLVTFYSPVSHVGMYVGDGKVLHASMPGVPIKVVPLAAAGPDPTGHAVNR